MQKRIGTVKGLLMLNEDGLEQVDSFVSDCLKQAKEDQFLVQDLLGYARKELFSKKKERKRWFQRKESNPYQRLIQKYSILLTEAFEKNIGADLVYFLYDLFEDFEQDPEDFSSFLEEVSEIKKQQKEGEILKKLGDLKKNGIEEFDFSNLSMTSTNPLKEEVTPSKESLEITMILNQIVETMAMQTPEVEQREIEEAIQKCI